MEGKTQVVQFSIAKISTEQFAIIEEAFQEGKAITLGTKIRFAVDKDRRLVRVICGFDFKQDQVPFLKVEIANHFSIDPESWEPFIRDGSTVVIPKEFASHLAMITVGTARGVLHSKTEGTKFNAFILPSINVTEIVKEDATFAPEKQNVG